MSILKSRHYRARSRQAVAATELAILLPLFVMLVLASIEACTMIFLEHSLSISSYEGVRVGIRFDATSAQVLDRCEELLEERNVNDSEVSINPEDVAAVPRGQTIAVTVSAPCDSNAIISPWFFGGKTLTATATMVKE
jgi:hypothetical protein